MNIKISPIIVLLICFCLQQLPTLSCDRIYKKPQSYNSYRENISTSDDFYDYDNRYTDIIPNPIVYLYGKSTNNDPILLMVFSSTIPVEWLNGEKSSNLDSATLKLKITPLHGYFYKILKISADQILQDVSHSTSSTIYSHAQGSGNFPAGGGGSGSVMGELSHTFNRSKAYDTIKPIITYSGVGSDTLTLMLKRGEEYPIPNGRINVYMLVRAIRDESNKIGDIINKYYNSTNEDEFYKNYAKFKNGFDCLIWDVSSGKYKDIDTFFKANGIKISNSGGFQYKKVNDFIATSVFLKYKNRNELKKDLYAKEFNDPDIKKLVDKLISNSNNPDSFLNRVNNTKKCKCECKHGLKCKSVCKGKDYVNIDYKLNQNIIDFINSIPLEKLVFENTNKVKLLNNVNVSLNNTDSDKVSDDSAKSSDEKKAEIKFSDYDLYATAYELKMLISAYKYAFDKINKPDTDNLNLASYIKDGDKDIYHCQCPAEENNKIDKKYQTIINLNNSIGVKAGTNGNAFDFELQKSAAKLIDDMFNAKNKQKKNMDDILKVISLDNLVCKASNGKIRSWNALKYNSYYKYKYYDAITLIGKIYDESNDEKNKDETVNQDLIDLVTNNNNVDLKFKKTIVQNKKNTFLNFEKDRIDRWCPPLISRVVFLPVGTLLWPLQLVDRRIEYHPTKCAQTTSKILEGSAFDKTHQSEDGYIKDDKDYIFKDMESQIERLKNERESTIIKPTIQDPHKTSFK